MKKIKILTSLCVLVLTLACLSFGVYSAIKATFTASGTITFNAYNLDLDVVCTITGVQGGTKTLYGTTFAYSTNATASGDDRSNFLNDSKIKTDDTHFDLSTAGASMLLNELAFDELNSSSSYKNEIKISFAFTNYSEYAVKAEGKFTKFEPSAKLDYDEGGATILSGYTSGKTTNKGVFDIYITPKNNGAVTKDLNNDDFSISINVSPEGIVVDGSTVYDTSVADLANAQNKNIKYPGLYYIDNVAYSSVYEEIKDGWQTNYTYTALKSFVIVPSTVFNVEIDTISAKISGGEDTVAAKLSYTKIIFSKKINTLGAFFGITSNSLFADLKGITSYIGMFTGDNGHTEEEFIIPEGVENLGDGVNICFGYWFSCTSLSLPISLKKVNKEAIPSLGGFFQQLAIKYAGTIEQFKQVNWEDGAISGYKGYPTIECSDGTIQSTLEY